MLRLTLVNRNKNIFLTQINSSAESGGANNIG